MSKTQTIDAPARVPAHVVPAPPAVPAQVSDATAIVAMIERAARDPNVDVDKMDRLLQMQERVMARTAKAEYDEALAVMQPELPVIAERGEIKNNSGKVQSTYALWEDINDAIKPILHKHGFALSFRTGQREGKIVVTGVLSHRAGHREETTMELPADGSGSKNAVQAVGSSTSYGQRYTAKLLLNLTSRGQDDDGKGAITSDLVTEDQVATLMALLDEVRADKVRFLTYMAKVAGRDIAALPEIPARHFAAAVNALNMKRSAR